MSKIAIKRLTKSDLTLFSWHFKEMNSGNQKSINLNANVFIDKLYPDLPNISAQKGKTSFLVDLSIYGPGAAPKHSLARKIVKGAAYKNWRLNGEFIGNPIDAPDRYNRLREGDYGILIFGGEPVFDELKLILVSSHHQEDFEFHSSITVAMNGESMKAFNLTELEALVNVSDIDATHAARVMDIDGAFEDASQGGISGVQALQRWSAKRKISKDDLRRARDRADSTGAIGEEFVDYYLGCQLSSGMIEGYKWASNENAIEAYDFVINESVYIDVKATSGSFNQKLHVSINELLHMRDLDEYRLYRIYAIDGKSAKLRISAPLNLFAKSVLDRLDPVLDGVRVDTVSVSPETISFGPEINVEIFSLG
ncbi:DUF3883 domain-containing protein [Pseudomonas capsici]|uniref:DUF3883 domain-containing protein n=1 Tax=Pseudomonas capsici TaxID=2810614 RepID=UPI0019D1D42E|nr:DUF3883 domain-containing protein [Pseudomonas capsici]MBN6717221.1 DUF3883 domain-containing protein [Pseudomonas capsici]MBN6722122.1 DUF3883 domain-containing protein [Pseudomonas capsici]MBN6727183.1 DUF3883 domain-containing protein [Pseudomonas capsici]